MIIVPSYAWPFLLNMSLFFFFSIFADIEDKIEEAYVYLDIIRRGNLSSLTWVTSPLKYQFDLPMEHVETCMVHYGSINFRDVMITSGRLAIPHNWSKWNTNNSKYKSL